MKYIKLFKDIDYPHRPDVLGVVIIDFDENDIPYFTNLYELGLERESIKIIESDFSVETFINKVRALCVLKK